MDAQERRISAKVLGSLQGNIFDNFDRLMEYGEPMKINASPLFILLFSLSAQTNPLTEEQKASFTAIQSIIIVDMDHGERSQLEHELKLLQMIKSADPSFDCLFKELEPSAEIPILEFLKGKDYMETVGLWISESSRKIKFPFKNIIPNWYLTKVNELGFVIKGADVEWSSELGQRIIPLIKKYNEKSGDLSEYGPLMVGERSRVMAERLITSLVSKTCKKVVLVVGDGHLEPLGFKPIQQYLKDVGISGGVLH